MADAQGRVVGYARVSTYDQSEAYGLDIQRRAIKEYCARWSLELDTIYEDAVSSQHDENRRPRLRALVDEAKAGRISLIIIHKQDRLARSVEMTNRLWSYLPELGAPVVEVSEAPTTRDTSQRVLTRNILASISQYERELILSRTLAGRNARIDAGHIPPGRPPYGYIYIPADKASGRLATLKIDEPRRSDIERTFQFAAYGDAHGQPFSMRGLAKHLDKVRIRTAEGSLFWQEASLRNILGNPVYHGQMMVSRRDPSKGSREVPAIVSESLWRQANEQVAWNKSHLRRRAHNPYLLSGLVYHPQCGRHLKGALKSKKNWRTYQCDGCLKSKGTNILDNAVWLTVGGRLLDKKWKAHKGPGGQELRKVERLKKQITDLEDRLAEFRREFAAREISKGEYGSLRAELVIGISARQEELAEVERQMAGSQVREAVFQRQDLIRFFLERQFSVVAPEFAFSAIQELIKHTVERVELDGNRAVIRTTAVLDNEVLEIEDVRQVVEPRLARWIDAADPRAQEKFLAYYDPRGEVQLREYQAWEYRGWEEALWPRDAQDELRRVRAIFTPWRLAPDDPYYLEG